VIHSLARHAHFHVHFTSTRFLAKSGGALVCRADGKTEYGPRPRTKSFLASAAL